jgi:hypothetical protein
VVVSARTRRIVVVNAAAIFMPFLLFSLLLLRLFIYLIGKHQYNR